MAIEVVSPGSRFAQRRLLREVPGPGRDARAVAGRLDALVRAGALCAAIELAGWALRQTDRRSSRRESGRLRREGLARNMVGLLMLASADEGELGAFAAFFRQFALEEFRASISLLPGEYRPHCNLASVHEAEGKPTTGHQRYRHFSAAIDEYRLAGKAARNLAEPAGTAAGRKIDLRRIRAQLLSDIGRFRDPALVKLEELPPDVAADCRSQRPQRAGARRLAPSGRTRPVLDEQTAECLYNSACTYAIAAGKTGRLDWDEHARRLLGAALVVDAAGHERYLWSRAKDDRDLDHLSRGLKDFMDVLLDAVPADHDQEMTVDDVKRIAAKAAADAGWHAPPRSRRPDADRAA